MLDMLVLADDLAGALDTGVQFARRSIPTLVSTRIDTLDQGIYREISVIVLDLDSRHLPPERAAGRVRRAVERSRRIGVRRFYKKTDSTLRGNIGSELTALLESCGGSMLAFVPAYPENGRTTEGGRQFVDGVPLHLSAYAEDPQDPVSGGSIREIIAAQSSIAVETVETPEEIFLPEPGQRASRIVVFDARTGEDMRKIAERLDRLGLLHLSAGCAGFAAHLSRVLDFRRREQEPVQCQPGLLVVCGSTNPVSLEQVERAVRRGTERFVLEPERLSGGGLKEGQDPAGEEFTSRIEEILRAGGDLILQAGRGQATAGTAGAQRGQFRRVAEGLAELAARILRSGRRLTPVVFGGDTARALVDRLGGGILLPVEQIAPGVVLSRLAGELPAAPLITKAGGFGPPEVIEEIKRYVSSRPGPASRCSGSSRP
ncbi:MAG: four-carbon acid sugar kinase family protein [Spirochaetales bacterium]|nr:four-carbon acid sugar kinase family protein [Spirochaetales bacterium]